MIKILVPLDFSDTSSNALYYAIQLFQGSSLEITLVHVFSTNPTIVALKNIDSFIEQDSKQMMDELIAKVKKEYPDVILKFKILKEHVVSAISSLGNSGNYDFIVMGTQGATGLKEVFLGSVAGGVISKTSAPVIVVPTGYSFRHLDEIVLALSDNAISDATEADPLRIIARMHKSKIKVLQIEDKKLHDIEKALTIIEDLKPSVDHIFGTLDVNTDLHDYMIKNDASLLCLIRGKKGFLDRLLKDSVTLKQTFESPVPLLILHDIVPL